MEYSGKIIKIIGNEAIVMTKDFEVVRIKLRKKVNIGEKIYFLAKDIIMEGFNTPVNLSEFVVDSQSAIDKEFQTSEKVSYFEKKKSKKLFNAIAISASFVLIFVLMQFFTVFNKKEYTYIDVDINPSFSFTVDKSGMVDSIDLLNEDAGQFVEGLKLKRISFVDVLKSILNNYKNQLVFPEDETIVFIAAAFDGKNNYEAKEKKFLDELISLNEILEKNEVKNITIKAVIFYEKIRNEALENKISMGRYVIYQQAKSDLEISLDVVREKSIYELLEVVDIQDSDGLCALVEFDMSEQEFVLQEMPMAEAEMEQVQDAHGRGRNGTGARYAYGRGNARNGTGARNAYGRGRNGTGTRYAYGRGNARNGAGARYAYGRGNARNGTGTKDTGGNTKIRTATKDTGGNAKIRTATKDTSGNAKIRTGAKDTSGNANTPNF